jgi:hypothetical protein
LSRMRSGRSQKAALSRVSNRPDGASAHLPDNAAVGFRPHVDPRRHRLVPQGVAEAGRLPRPLPLRPMHVSPTFKLGSQRKAIQLRPEQLQIGGKGSRSMSGAIPYFLRAELTEDGRVAPWGRRRDGHVSGGGVCPRHLKRGVHSSLAILSGHLSCCARSERQPSPATRSSSHADYACRVCRRPVPSVRRPRRGLNAVSFWNRG